MLTFAWWDAKLHKAELNGCTQYLLSYNEPQMMRNWKEMIYRVTKSRDDHNPMITMLDNPPNESCTHTSLHYVSDEACTCTSLYHVMLIMQHPPAYQSKIPGRCKLLHGTQCNDSNPCNLGAACHMLTELAWEYAVWEHEIYLLLLGTRTSLQDL